MRIAVIGCGRWGPNHIRVFGSLPDCQVVAAVDPDPQRLEAVRGLGRDLRTFTDPQFVFDDPGIDAVVIATPTATHAELVRRALEAGKHVLVEKPLTDNAEAGRALVELAARTNRILMVGHVFVYNPSIVALKKIVASGDLGTLYYLSAERTNLGPIRSDVNAAWDLMSHDISIFNFFLGSSPLSVSARGAWFLQPGIEDVVFATFEYPQGVLAHVHASWLNPLKVRRITLVGSQRMATWDDLALQAPIALFHKGAAADGSVDSYGQFLRIRMWDEEVRMPTVPFEEPLKAQARAFVEAVRSSRPPVSDGHFGLQVVETLEALQESLRRKGVSVDINEAVLGSKNVPTLDSPMRS